MRRDLFDDFGNRIVRLPPLSAGRKEKTEDEDFEWDEEDEDLDEDEDG